MPSGLKGLLLLYSTCPLDRSFALSQPQWKAKPEEFSLAHATFIYISLYKTSLTAVPDFKSNLKICPEEEEKGYIWVAPVTTVVAFTFLFSFFGGNGAPG